MERAELQLFVLLNRLVLKWLLLTKISRVPDICHSYYNYSGVHTSCQLGWAPTTQTHLSLSCNIAVRADLALYANPFVSTISCCECNSFSLVAQAATDNQWGVGCLSAAFTYRLVHHDVLHNYLCSNISSIILWPKISVSSMVASPAPIPFEEEG